MFKNKSILILAFLIKSTSYAAPWDEKEPPKNLDSFLNSSFDNSIEEENTNSKNSMVEEERIEEEVSDNDLDLRYKISPSPITENMG